MFKGKSCNKKKGIKLLVLEFMLFIASIYAEESLIIDKVKANGSTLDNTPIENSDTRESLKTVSVTGYGVSNAYNVEYMQKISEYLNVDIEIKESVNWLESLRMLRAGEVDFITSAQNLGVVNTGCIYTSMNYGYAAEQLVALPSSKYTYKDYKAINSSVIGNLVNAYSQKQFNDYCSINGISPKVKLYKNSIELFSALLTNQVDMVLVNSVLVPDEWSLVDKLSYYPLFLMALENRTDLINKLNDALVRIALYEQNYTERMMSKYYPYLMLNPFSQQELELINNEQVYTVYFDPKTKPLAWKNSKGEMEGVLIQVIKQLEANTGLKMIVADSNNKPDVLTEYDVDYYMFSYEYKGIDKFLDSEEITSSLVDTTYGLYHLSGSPFNSTKQPKIAVIQNREGLYLSILQKFPSGELVLYDNPSACLAAVINKKVDVACLGTQIADLIINSKSYRNIIELPFYSSNFGISLHFNGSNKEMLVNIINKGLSTINNSEIGQYLVDVALNNSPDISLNYLLFNHTWQFMIGLMILIVLVSIITSVYTYARAMKKDKLKIEKADKARTDFFARMSHDMRTPMNGILGMIELTEQATTLAEAKDNMVKAKASGQYMLSLINDTLDLQRLESGKLSIEPRIVYVREFVQNILEMVKVSIDKKHITLETSILPDDIECYVKLDPVRVKQVFVNVLSNAIKFTPEQGEIKIDMKILSRTNGIATCVISISDTGIGISREYLDKNIFRAYSQEQNEITSKYAGSGLGLAITKNLLDLMGGRISVESEMGEGSTFTIYMKFQMIDKKDALEEKNEKIQNESQMIKKLQNKKILICEDHPLNSEIAKRLLEHVGCSITIAENGKVGLEYFEKSDIHFFDAILMDIRMPIMDGIETTKRIRTSTREDAITIPIIAMTANAYDEDIKKSFEAGMNAHLAKPINPLSLYSSLVNNMEK